MHKGTTGSRVAPELSAVFRQGRSVQITSQTGMHVERPGIDGLVNPYLFHAGARTCAIEPDQHAAGMVSPDQGAAHALFGIEPFTLLVLQAACAQQRPYLRMAVSHSDLTPLLGHLEWLGQGNDVDGQQQCGNQQQETAEDTHFSVLLCCVPEQLIRW
jgi:hypothetical protein